MVFGKYIAEAGTSIRDCPEGALCDSGLFTRALIILSCAVFWSLLLFKLPLTPIFSESDHLIFVHEGSRLLQGDVMYVDFFQFTFPGTQAYYAGLIALFSHTYLIIPFTIVLLLGCLSFLSLCISRGIIVGPLAYLPTLIFAFFGTRYFGLDASHRLFSIVFVLFAILTLVKGTSHARLVVAGLACALASFFTQQRGVASVVAIFCFLLAENLVTGRSWRELAEGSALLLGSFLVSLIFLAGYFVIAAGPAHFFSATVEFPAYYFRSAPPNEFGVLISDTIKSVRVASNFSGLLFLLSTMFYAFVLPLSVGVVFVGLFAWRRRFEWSEIRVPMLLLIVWVSLLVFTAGHSPGRLFQISPLALILVCWFVSMFTSGKRVISVFIAGFLLLGTAQVIRMQTAWNFSIVELPAGQIAFTSPEQAEFYTYLDAVTEPADELYEVTQPFVYFPLQLKNPTSMSQIWPFDYTRPEQVDSVIRDLDRSKPEFIVWPTSYSKVPLRSGDHTGPLARFVAEWYRPTGVKWTSNGFTVELMQRIDTVGLARKAEPI